MNILLITSIYLPHIGGIELYVNHLAKCFIEKGDKVTVLVGSNVTSNYGIQVEDGIKVIRIPVYEKAGIAWIKRWTDKDILKSELKNADIVHLNDIKFLYRYLAKNKKRFGYELFFSSHGFIFHTDNYLGIKKVYMKYMQMFSSQYNINYCVSSQDYQIAETFHIANRKVVVPGTDIKKFTNITATSYEKNTFVYWGRIAQNKGIIPMIKVFARLNVPFELYIIGKCDDLKYTYEINEFIAKSGKKNNIHILGYMDDKVLVRYIEKSEYLLFPSLHEGFGVTLVEALATGKKIIANDIETFREILNDVKKQIFLFNFGDENNNLENKLKELSTYTYAKLDLYKYSYQYCAETIREDYTMFLEKRGKENHA